MNKCPLCNVPLIVGACPNVKVISGFSHYQYYDHYEKYRLTYRDDGSYYIVRVAKNKLTYIAEQIIVAKADNCYRLLPNGFRLIDGKILPDIEYDFSSIAELIPQIQMIFTFH